MLTIQYKPSPNSIDLRLPSNATNRVLLALIRVQCPAGELANSAGQFQGADIKPAQRQRCTLTPRLLLPFYLPAVIYEYLNHLELCQCSGRKRWRIQIEQLRRV